MKRSCRHHELSYDFFPATSRQVHDNSTQLQERDCRTSVMAALGMSAFPLRGVGARVASAELFTCRQCLRQRNQATRLFSSRTTPRTPSQKSPRVSSYLGALRKNFKAFTIPRSASLSTATAAQLTVEQGASATRSHFPDVSSKAVAYWLLGSAASVFGIVIFGGLTRLTESG